MRAIQIILAALIGAPSAANVEWSPSTLADYATITNGVSEITRDGAPGGLVLFGPEAFPIVRDSAGAIFLAGARFGRGRVIAGSHTEYTDGNSLAANPALGRLMRQATTWLADGVPGARIGAHSSCGGARPAFEAAGFEVVDGDPAALGGLAVFCVNANARLSGRDQVAVRDYVTDGGGLLVTGTPWAYSVDNFAENLPGNRMMSNAGVLFAEGYIWPEAGPDLVSASIPSVLTNAGYALEVLIDHAHDWGEFSLADRRLAAQSVSGAIRWLTWGTNGYWNRLELLAAGVGGIRFPLERASEPEHWVIAEAQMKRAEHAPAADLTANPHAADFPGAVPADAPRDTVTLTLDGSYVGVDPRRLYSNPGEPVWRSTGRYAAAGELVEVTVAARAASAGLSVLIGSHTDDIGRHDRWERFPRVTRAWPITAPVTEVASAFGGLIYLRVPAGTQLGAIEVTVAGGVPAMNFEHGLTSDSDWTEQRSRLAPWAEIGSDRFIITVPAAVLSAVDAPGAVTEFWVEVLDADADLAAMDRNRPRPERLVADRQISAGWLHSGYPFMGHAVHGPEALDVETLRSSGNWGMFHELGHNHQWADWMIPHSTEVTCNLWSVYAYETLVESGVEGHEAIAPQTRADRLDAYVAAGARYETWDPWIGLELFLQLKEAFTWEAYKQLFARYRDFGPGERPGEVDRIDFLVVNFSEIVSTNLLPFFRCWGLPVSDWVEGRVENLPGWAADPMLAYCGSCGDGLRSGDEVCDDGNQRAGDGCDAACDAEEGFTCVDDAPSICSEDPKPKPEPVPVAPPGDAHPSCGCSGGLDSSWLLLLALGFRRRRPLAASQ
jgi:cysteine-rich repeat protein